MDSNGRLQRLRYYKGQLLTAQDFTDQQRYHNRKLELLLKRFPHGIIGGLDVECSTDEQGTEGIRITEGLAVDQAGHQLFVDEDGLFIPLRDLESHMTEQDQTYIDIVLDERCVCAPHSVCESDMKYNRIAETVRVEYADEPNAEEERVTLALIKHADEDKRTCGPYQICLGKDDLGRKIRIEAAVFDTNMISDGAITTEKLGTSAVTEAVLADNAVTSAKLADASILIGEGDVTTEKLDDGAVTATKLAPEAVTTEKLTNGAITHEKLREGAVRTAELNDQAVTSSKIAEGAITSSKLSEDVEFDIPEGAITAARLAEDAVTTAKLATHAVATSKLAPGAVTVTKLADEAVRTDKLQDQAVTAAKIADRAVEAAKLDLSTAATSLPHQTIPAGETVEIAMTGDIGPDDLRRPRMMMAIPTNENEVVEVAWRQKVQRNEDGAYRIILEVENMSGTVAEVEPVLWTLG